MKSLRMIFWFVMIALQVTVFKLIMKEADRMEAVVSVLAWNMIFILSQKPITAWFLSNDSQS